MPGTAVPLAAGGRAAAATEEEDQRGQGQKQDNGVPTMDGLAPPLGRAACIPSRGVSGMDPPGPAGRGDGVMAMVTMMVIMVMAKLMDLGAFGARDGL